MNESTETFEHNGCTVEIHYDDHPTSPRDADEVGIMLANGHRNYTLGDEEFRGGWLARMRTSDYDDAERALAHFAEVGKLALFPRWAMIYLGSTVVLPLGLIDHSGISMYVAGRWASTGDASNQFDPGGWDSGLVGFIFDTANTREQIGTEPEHVEEALRAEVDLYDDYLTGQVFGYVIEDADGDEIDSCWGMYGLNFVRQEARDAAGYTCKHCQRGLRRWVGPVVDTKPEDDEHGFVHTICSTCHSDVVHQDKAWWHISADGTLSVPHEPLPLTHRHACASGTTFAETDQTVGSYQ